MRLLHFQEHNGELSLVDCVGDNIPHYAILSHTWGPNSEEVSFQDLESNRGKEKFGYQKIRWCGEQARRDGLQYFWVDTCCIDKTSSAELSESINTMFQWYQNATICYAYLSDVMATEHRQNTMVQFIRSRWFTRGWTLQELLAPEKLKFYGQNWKYLGDKTSCIDELRNATNINFGALSWSWTLPSYSIATRMSWVSKRTTTRIEDHAYCMLGILGVHMPLLYGEGKNAFRRLQEELIKISDDETIFAHNGSEILASCPRQFSSGKDHTILRKDISAPYSITNAGLHIHMRVLELTSDASSADDRTASALGVLHCHSNNAKNRNGYLALPLEITERANTYRKVPSPLRWVDATQATAIEYRTIFIQLHAFQISRITLLEDYDLRLYRSEPYMVKTHFMIKKTEREVRIYPKPSSEYEAVIHVFARDHKAEPPEVSHVVTIFELANERAGVLVLPSNVKFCNADAIFQCWKSQGRPASGELYSSASANPSEVATVKVIQKEHMKQFVWSLQVE